MEKKGLFERLTEFWREKIGAEEAEGIGFWTKGKPTEKSFAGKAAAFAEQKERKRTFWEKRATLAEKEQERGILEQEKRFFFLEQENGQEWHTKNAEDADGEKKSAREKKIAGEEKAVQAALPLKKTALFTAELFPGKMQTEAEESRLGQMFLLEKPEGKKKRQSIAPAAEFAKPEKVAPQESEKPQERAAESEAAKAETLRTEEIFDIEKLMQQITKKLWEERESCGRRLRG